MDKMGKEMTVAIVHYNTPSLTAACIQSLWKHTPAARVIIFDNSDRLPFATAAADSSFFILHSSLLEVLDNTRSQLIDFDQWLATFPFRETGPANKSNFGSAKHCYTVQWLIDHLDTPFFIMDSDTLIRRDITPIFNTRYAFVAHIGCNTMRRFGFEVLKADPFLCFINVPMIKAHDVTYFRADRMWGLTNKTPYNRYDTGAWFYEDCRKKNLPFLNIDMERHYIHHLGHASWKGKDVSEWLNTHRPLWS